MRFIFANWFTPFNTWKAALLEVSKSYKWHRFCVSMKTSWYSVAGGFVELLRYLILEFQGQPRL